MLPSKAMPHGQERVKDISCWLPSVPYHCKVTFIQFLFIWERRPPKKGILEQIEYFLVDTNLSAALSRIHKSPCGYNKFWTTELMTTRSLSFLARGMAAILNFLKLHCLMIFYNAELLQPQSQIYVYFPHLCMFKTYHNVCPVKHFNRYVSKNSQ